MLDQAYNVIVIGARVAGVTVAALLGDAGYRVLLVDRASFPSSTLSTHFFRGAGLLEVLSRLTILDRILALDAPPLVPVGPGWALVGDAGLHQDPWSGLGMDMASVHATFSRVLDQLV